MKKKVTQVIPIPYVLISFSLLPLFLLTNLLPAHADAGVYLRVDNFLNQYLFGTVGFWSSLFPFSSRLSTSYVSLFGPVFAVIAIYMARAKLVIDPDQYKNLTLKKYLFALLVLAMLLAMFISINYFEAVDLAGHNRKFRIFGLSTFMYSIFASAMFLSFYVIALYGYFACYYIPRLLIQRWRNCNV